MSDVFDDKLQQITLGVFERMEAMSEEMDVLKASYAELKAKVASLIGTHGDKTIELADKTNQLAAAQAVNDELKADVVTLTNDVKSLTDGISALITPKLATARGRAASNPALRRPGGSVGVKSRPCRSTGLRLESFYHVQYGVFLTSIPFGASGNP